MIVMICVFTWPFVLYPLDPTSIPILILEIRRRHLNLQKLPKAPVFFLFLGAGGPLMREVLAPILAHMWNTMPARRMDPWMTCLSFWGMLTPNQKSGDNTLDATHFKKKGGSLLRLEIFANEFGMDPNVRPLCGPCKVNDFDLVPNPCSCSESSTPKNVTFVDETLKLLILKICAFFGSGFSMTKKLPSLLINDKPIYWTCTLCIFGLVLCSHTVCKGCKHDVMIWFFGLRVKMEQFAPTWVGYV